MKRVAVEIKLNKAQETLLKRITDYIDNNDELPWESGIMRTNLQNAPYNPITKTKYSNSNMLTLLITSITEGFSDPRWLTWNQATSNKCSVKKGAKGTPITYVTLWSPDKEKYLNNDDYIGLSSSEIYELKSKAKVHVRTFTVFNANQVVGLPSLEIDDQPEVSFNDVAAQEFIEKLIKNINLDVHHISMGLPLYNVNRDLVQMPLPEEFISEENYYATLLHEIAHSTMHESRLNRDIKDTQKGYAQEELNAEFSSILLASDLGYVRDEKSIENHSAYIKSWKRILTDEPEVLFRSIQTALKIREYIHEKGNYNQKYLCENRQTKVSNKFNGKLIAIEVENLELGKELVNKLSRHFNSNKLLDPIIGDSLEFDTAVQNLKQRRKSIMSSREVNDNFTITNFDIRKAAYRNIHHFDEEANFAYQKMVDQFIDANTVPDITIKIVDDKAEYLDFENIKSQFNKRIMEVDRDQVSEEDISILINLINDQLNLETQSDKGSEDKRQTSLDVMKRDVLISDYAVNELGFTISKIGNYLTIKEHDSVRIYPTNTFYRNSNNVGGSIVDFIMHFESLNSNEAIKKLDRYYKENAPAMSKPITVQKRREFELPKPNKDNKRAIAYLTQTRTISPKIVDEMISKKLLYQDDMLNVVFVGMLNGKPVNGSRRGARVNSNFKGDVTDSRKAGGWFVDNNAETLIITESAIDAMSIMTIKSDYQYYDYLSANGVGNVIPVIDFHMGLRKKENVYTNVIIAFDNDRPGEDAMVNSVKHLKEEYPHINVSYQFPPGNVKDWNQELNVMVKKHEPSQEINLKLESNNKFI